MKAMKRYYAKPRVNIIEVNSYEGSIIEITSVKKTFFVNQPDAESEMIYFKNDIRTPDKSDIKLLEHCVQSTCIIIDRDVYSGVTTRYFGMSPKFTLEDDKIKVSFWRIEKFLEIHIDEGVSYVNGIIIKGLISVIYNNKLALVRETKKVKGENAVIYSEAIRRICGPIKPIQREIQLSFC